MRAFYFPTFFFLFISFFSFGQDLNLNRIAKARLSETNYYSCPYANAHCKFELKMIHTGKKDYDGNEVLYFKLYYVGVDGDTRNKGEYPDSILFVPDFDMYPLRYVMRKEKADLEIQFWNEDRMGIHAPSMGYTYLADTDEGGLLSSWFQSTNSTGISAKLSSGWNSEDYYVRSKGLEKKDAAWLEKTYSNEEVLLGEWKKIWVAADKYQKEQMELAKSKGYDQLLKDMAKGEYYFFRLGRANASSSWFYDPVKLSFREDASGKLTHVVLNFQYMYGKYSDKPEYQVEYTKNATTGFFEMREDIKHNIKTAMLIPFGGQIYLIKREQGKGGNQGIYIQGGIVDSPYNQMFHNVIRGKRIYPTALNRDESTNDRIEKVEAKHYKKLILEKLEASTYTYANDDLNFDVFMSKYLEALK